MLDALIALIALIALAHGDWATFGAIAGPVLAIASLAWQASERLRRPVLDGWYRFEPYGRMDRQEGEPAYGWRIEGHVRVINPRPSALIVEAVALQATASRWRPWHRTALDSRKSVRQIPPTDETEFYVGHDDLRAPSWVRIRVKLRGRRRPLSMRWSFEGVDAFSEEGRLAPGQYSGAYMRPSDDPYPSADHDPVQYRTRALAVPP